MADPHDTPPDPVPGFHTANDLVMAFMQNVIQAPGKNDITADEEDAA